MRVLASKELANGQELTFYDNSRRVAGDRWQLQLVGKVEMALDRVALAREVAGQPGLGEYIERELGGTLAFVVRRERNFVAEEDKERLLAEFQGELVANMAAYLAQPNFAAKFLVRRCLELGRSHALARQRQALVEEESEEESGPADFSACFRH